jgi:catechol 2,3-dioxygenase-like lactoylglutathione lyase family enzyme
MSINGISHVALSVTDLDRSAAWYQRALGWQELMRGHDVTEFAYGQLPSGLALVLRRHGVDAAPAFDETRPGLDHLSFSVDSVADLKELEATLQEMGAVFTPAKDLPHGWLLAFRDPDNIALEAQAPPS